MKFFEVMNLFCGVVNTLCNAVVQPVYNQYQKSKGRNTGQIIFYCESSEGHTSYIVNTFITIVRGRFILDDGSKINRCGVRKDDKRIYCCLYCYQKNKELLHKLYISKRRQWGSDNYQLQNLIEPFKDVKCSRSLTDILQPQLKLLKIKHRGEQTWKCLSKERTKGVMRAHDNQGGSKLHDEEGEGLCGTRKDNAGTWCCQLCWESRCN